MKHYLRKFSAPAVVGIVMATTMVSANATQPTRTQTDPTASSAAAQQPSSDQQRALIFAAAGRDALSLVEAARYELAQDNPAEARVHLHRASTLLGQVQQGLESRPLSANAPADKQDVISIYAQLGVTDQTALTEAMRDQLNAISGHIALGEHDKVVSGLEGLGIPTLYRYVEMPVGSTLGQVNMAIAAIDDQQIQKADEDLQAATAALHSDALRIGMDDEEQTG